MLFPLSSSECVEVLGQEFAFQQQFSNAIETTWRWWLTYLIEPIPRHPHGSHCTRPADAALQSGVCWAFGVWSRASAPTAQHACPPAGAGTASTPDQCDVNRQLIRGAPAPSARPGGTCIYMAMAGGIRIAATVPLCTLCGVLPAGPLGWAALRVAGHFLLAARVAKYMLLVLPQWSKPTLVLQREASRSYFRSAWRGMAGGCSTVEAAGCCV
jgi:hypothetical protein